MKMLRVLRDLFLYGGLSRDQFELVSGDVTEDNLRSLRLCAPIGCGVFFVLGLLSTVSSGVVAANTWIYFGSSLAMGIIVLSMRLFAKDRPRFTTLLMHLFIAVLYTFAITVSVNHLDYLSVSAIVFLVVVPLLFVERPLYIAVGTVLTVLAICISSTLLKDPTLAGDDRWNAVSFGTVAIVANILLMRMKFQSLYQKEELDYLSKTDALTGLKNRNCFEARLEDYPRLYSGELVCAYADANGLHMLNNEQGHDAGDRLICAIAQGMQGLFGEEHTYRIGGDEFVGFLPGGSLDEVRALLAGLKDRLDGEGHHMSWGAAAAVAAHANMRSLVREAEKQMFAQKFATCSTREDYERDSMLGTWT